MRRQSLLLVLAALGLLVAAPAAAPAGPPPPPPRNMPGELKGQVRTRWLAPYVSVTTRSIGLSGTTTVQWFTADGKPDRELSGPNVDVQPGFVYEYGQGKTTVHAVNGGWRIALPKKDGPAGYLTATEDSRTFVHEFHPREGEIAADVYVSGKLVGTVGPFLQYQGQDVQLGADGSLALLVAKDKGRETPRVVVVGPDAKVRFQADCDGPVLSPVPAPDGAGVLVKSNAGGDARNTFTFYRKSGKVSSLDIVPNADFVTWLPGSPTAVMATSIGYDYRFHLIDWESGLRLWEIADPNPARVPGEFPPVAADKDRLRIGGLEYVKWGDREQPVRSIYAVDARKGRVVAHWLPSPLYQPSADGGRFLKLGGKLYLITDAEFSEIDPRDITDKGNGRR